MVGLWLLVGLAPYVQAFCEIERFPFGTSATTVAQLLNIEPTTSPPPLLALSVITRSGTQLCPNDRSFTGVTVDMVFLYNQLVQFQVKVPSTQDLVLFEWATQRYGQPLTRSGGRPNRLRAGHFFWREPDRNIFLSFTRQQNNPRQELEITSRVHAPLFERHGRELEEAADRGRP